MISLFSASVRSRKIIPAMMVFSLALLSGCSVDGTGWSSEKSWREIEKNKGFGVDDVVGTLFSREMLKASKEADKDFEREAKAAATSSLPPGGLDVLLTRVADAFAPTVTSVTSGLEGGGAGIIVLGDIKGPDGQPLNKTVKGQVSQERFLGYLVAPDKPHHPHPD